MAERVELPSGTVTFLFTDIEGSTRLWEAHPEAMRLALERHDELVRAAVERSLDDGTLFVTPCEANADVAELLAVRADRRKQLSLF